MHLFERLQRRDPPPPPEIDRQALRDQMTREDPDLAHVRDVAHGARDVLAGNHAARQLLDRWNADLDRAWRRDARQD